MAGKQASDPHEPSTCFSNLAFWPLGIVHLNLGQRPSIGVVIRQSIQLDPPSSPTLDRGRSTPGRGSRHRPANQATMVWSLGFCSDDAWARVCKLEGRLAWHAGRCFPRLPTPSVRSSRSRSGSSILDEHITSFLSLKSIAHKRTSYNLSPIYYVVNL